MKNDVTTLSNCDTEAIHLLGTIQSHGAILAFNEHGELNYFSENAAQYLGTLPKIDCKLSPNDLHLLPGAYALILDYFALIADDPGLVQTLEVSNAQNVFDLVIHQYANVVIVEFELRDTPINNLHFYSLNAQKALNRLKAQKNITSLLDATVEEIRKISGFDRVMAYQFHPDDSGEVVAECAREDMFSFYGRRYPASDIPAQARRLYVENTLRMIVDVKSTPVKIIGSKSPQNLDLSRSILRSVSPIHIEYLINMGVYASMSISIVIDGKLWGLIACHHDSRLQVPYSVRMTCEILCLIISSSIQQIETKMHADLQIKSNTLLAEVKTQLMENKDFSSGLFNSFDRFNELIKSDSSIISYASKIHSQGDISPALSHPLIHWLKNNQSKLDFYHIDALKDAPVELIPLLGEFCGIIALNICKLNNSWLVFLRKEQLKTIKWGGKPEKNYTFGPSGARLTPRASFEEWKEIVHETAIPWSKTDLENARNMHMDLVHESNKNNAEIDRVKSLLMSVLGHDLRDPLNTISMAAQLHELQSGSNSMVDRIKVSSGRMQRLISLVMDLTGLQSGIGMGLTKTNVNLSLLMEDLIEDVKFVYPEVIIKSNLSKDAFGLIDSDRVSQAITNLISNARHHGEIGTEISIHLETNQDEIVFSVQNYGKPIPDELVKVLFNPYKIQSLDNKRNQSGLGLGLYIAEEIIKGHKGKIAYDYRDDQIVFEVRLPIEATLAREEAK